MSTLRGTDVQIDRDYVSVVLGDGRIIRTPLSWYPQLRDASSEQQQRWQFIGRGTGIAWAEIDYHLSIEGMLFGVPERGHAMAASSS